MTKKYLINKILKTLDNTDDFTHVLNIQNPIDKYNMFKKSSFILNIHKIEHDIGSYSLRYYILDQIMLDLTTNVNTKNYYFIQETIKENLIDILYKSELENVKWFVTHDTHLSLVNMANLYKNDKWTSLIVGDKKIKTLDCNFPKDIIFGISNSIMINENETIKSLNDIEIINGIKLVYYYNPMFYAIRMITDPKKKKVFLRENKIKQIINKIS